jgi:hypothetical protein
MKKLHLLVGLLCFFITVESQSADFPLGQSVIFKQDSSKDNDNKLPLDLIEQKINERLKMGIKPEQILISFDYDGSLYNSGIKGLTGLRGNKDTEQKIIEWSKLGVRFMINTAAGRAKMSTIPDQLERLKIPELSQIFYLAPSAKLKVVDSLTRKLKDTYSPKMIQEKSPKITTKDGENPIYISGTMVTGEGNNYYKAECLFQYMKLQGIEGFDTVIVVDDASVNIMDIFTMLRSLVSEEAPKIAEKLNLFMFYVPRSIESNEPDQEENEKKIEEIISKNNKKGVFEDVSKSDK